MKRLLLLSLLGVAAACADDRPNAAKEPSIAEPPAPVLTAKMLPASASSVCVASVRQRDALFAAVGATNGVTSSVTLTAKQRAELGALDEMISDVCE